MLHCFTAQLLLAALELSLCLLLWRVDSAVLNLYFQQFDIEKIIVFLKKNHKDVTFIML